MRAREPIHEQKPRHPPKVFCKGYTPRDIKNRGRVVKIGAEISINGVSINDGDVIFADSDAVVVVPESVKNEVMTRLKQVISNESKIKRLRTFFMRYYGLFKKFK